MNKKKVLNFLTAAVLFLLLQQEYLSAEKTKKLTFFTWVPIIEYNVNKELVKEFEKNNPGVKIEYVNVPTDEAMQKLQIMFAGNTAPDVMSIHGAFFYQFASKGLLLDMGKMLDKSIVLKRSDFYPKLIEGCKYNGILYSLPRYTSVYVLFYNRDMFDRARIPYPDYTWTWETFRDNAIKLTSIDQKKPVNSRYGYMIDFWGARLYPWIWQNDGKIYDLKRNLCQLDDKNTVEAIQFLVDLKNKYHVTPSIASLEFKSGIENFKVGKVGMFVSGAWDIQNLQDQKSFKWNIAPLPKNRKRATMLGMENYAISSMTKEKELSFKFMEFLLSKKTQMVMADTLDKQPSLIESGRIYAKNKEPVDRKVLVDALDYAVVPPNFAQYNMVLETMQHELDLIWVRDKNVSQALTEATQKINKALNKKN